MKDSDKMHENRAGYNAYFLKSNLNALSKARMPNYNPPSEMGQDTLDTSEDIQGRLYMTQN